MPRLASLECSPLEPREVPAAGMFADIYPDVWGSYPQNITPAGNTLFFTANDAVHGEELWATDGTAAGTHLVKDINPGRPASNPSNLLATDSGRVYFTADGGTGPTLWSSDGTAAGTVNLGLKNTTQGLTFPAGNGVLYLMADDGQGHGNILWRTDGTAGGTVPVTGVPDALRTYLTVPPPSTGVHVILAHNGWDTFGWKGDLYFVTQDTATGDLTWAKTDGTDTTALTDFNGAAGTATAEDPSVRVVGDRLEFMLTTKAGRAMVWQTDGTAAGTQLLKQDVTATSPTAGTVTFTGYDGVEISPGKFVYAGADGQPGTSLWVGDGHTPDSFQPLRSFTDGSTVYSLQPVGGKVYALVGPIGGPQASPSAGLWVTDGTPAGTRKIDGIVPMLVNPVAGSIGDRAVVKQSFFGGRYWVTDGTAAGLSLLPVPPGTENVPWSLVGNLPPDAANPNGFLLFQEAPTGRVYRTDGTAAGTALIDLTGLPAHRIGGTPIQTWMNGGANVWLSNLDPTFRYGLGFGAYFKGAVYYSGKTDVQRAELWRWDLTGQPTTTPAPTVTGTRVNDGSAQRSVVKTLTVTFDSAVNVAAGGLTITNAAGQSVAFTRQATTANGVTTLTVTFPTGVGGSIADGRYTLKIAATAVSKQSDGTAMATDYTFGFTRLFGDLTGDGVYDRAARSLVHQLLGHRLGDADFNPALDVNGNGVIDAADETAVVRNWGKSV